MDKKKTLVVAVFLALFVMASGAFAIWLLSGQDDVVVTVVSEDVAGTLIPTIVFSDFELNASAGDVNGTAGATFCNPDGDIDVELLLTDTVVDVEDACTDYMDDCVMTVSHRDTGLTYNVGEPAIVPLTSACTNNFDVTLSCKKSSCPQEHTGVLTLQQV